MQVDSGSLFMGVASAAIPALIAFSYGYGRLGQKIDGLSSTLTKGLVDVKKTLVGHGESLNGLDRRLLVIETRCPACNPDLNSAG